MKFYNVYVTYGKSNSYVQSDNVPEDLIADYVNDTVNTLRRINRKKQITFSFHRPFVAVDMGHKCATSFSGYCGNGMYKSYDCKCTEDLKEKKENIVVPAIG